MATESGTPETEAVELCRRYVEEFINGGDRTVAAAVLHENVTAHQLGVETVHESRESLVETLMGFRDAVPDWHLTIEDAVGQDDRVIMRVTARGTPKRAWGDLIPTGKSFEAAAFFAFRVEDGRIVEVWNLVNAMGIGKQLGLMPPGPRVVAKVLSHRIRSRLGAV